MPTTQHEHYYIAPNFRVSVQIKNVAVSRLVDIRAHSSKDKTSNVICVPRWLPLVIETKDGLLPLDPPEALELELGSHPEAARIVVLILAPPAERRELRLIRLVRRFLWERPYLGHKSVKHLAHWLLSDYAEELIECLHPEARLTTSGVCLAINSLENRQVTSRTSVHRALAHIRHARQSNRVCPSRRKRALYRAQRKLDLPNDDDPDEAPA